MMQGIKRFSCAFAIVLAVSLFFIGTGDSAEVVFRPGPGLNDGTDDGSENAGKDASGGDCAGPTVNYGSSSTLGAVPITTCNNCNMNGYIQFNIDTLPENVSQVFIGFTHIPHVEYCYSNCTDQEFYFYPITGAWNEMTVTLANEPSHGAAVYGPITISFPNDFGNREYEITDLYRKWKNGTIPNYGIKIASTTGTCNNAAVYFGVNSSDAIDPNIRPYLRIITDDSSQATPVPTISEWGMMILSLVMVGSAIGIIRRRQIQ